MIEATRNWFRRNRTRFALGLGLLGGTYLLAQYVLSKIAEARERMSSDRIARENLRRRFQQNQEDCTFTVLALLPTAAENILDALPVEDITHELQQQRAEKLGRSVATSEISPSEFSSAPKSPTQPGDKAAGAAADESKSQDGQAEETQPVEGQSNDTAQAAEHQAVEAQSQEASHSQDGQEQDTQSQSSDSFIHTSQMGQSTFADSSHKPRKTKAQLWNDLKIQSITRTFTMVYTVALLTLFTRIQLNLLGRRSYLSSVVSLATPPAQDATISLENHDDDRGEGSYGHDFETNRKFLTFSWWLLHQGWRDIKTKVEAAVSDIFSSVNVREDFSLERLSQLVVEVRKKVEGATAEERRSQKWLTYLLPPPEQEMFVLNESGILKQTQSSSVALGTPASEYPPSSPVSISPTDPLRRLLDETSDLIDSPTASHITTLLLDSLFGYLIDLILRTQAFKLPPLPSASALPNDPSFIDPSQRIIDVTEHSHLASGSDFASARAKLATILAVITRQAHAIGSGVPNEYVQSMENVRELEAFAAVVYSSNFEIEGVRIEEERRSEESEAGFTSSQHSHAKKSFLGSIFGQWW